MNRFRKGDQHILVKKREKVNQVRRRAQSLVNYRKNVRNGVDQF
jgi:hypothetical protein